MPEIKKALVLSVKSEDSDIIDDSSNEVMLPFEMSIRPNNLKSVGDKLKPNLES